MQINLNFKLGSLRCCEWSNDLKSETNSARTLVEKRETCFG